MSAYYNENDPKAAAWLRELIRNGHIAPGDVDDRSIEAVEPRDLEGFTQCHFFAGIGGWSYAPDVCAPSYGVPARMGFLRGYGNALVPQQASEFIQAYLDT